jgi:hypothetical protein
MIARMMKIIIMASLICILGGTLAGAENPDFQKYSGYWTGSGVVWEKVADDAFRKLTRRSETQFWFVVDKEGKITGEGFISYEAQLQAMSWQVPLPSGGSIDAEVSGSSEKTTRKYEIWGNITEGNKLSIKVANETENMTIPGAEFEFSIVATVTIPVGAGGLGTEAKPEFQVIKIPAKAWSPFQGREPFIEAHVGGPHLAEVSESAERYSLEWHAIQMISPRFSELETRIDSLEEQLENLVEQLEE